jgi:hypothetical protein
MFFSRHTGFQKRHKLPDFTARRQETQQSCKSATLRAGARYVALIEVCKEMCYSTSLLCTKPHHVIKRPAITGS